VPDSCSNFCLLSNLAHASPLFMFEFWLIVKFGTCKGLIYVRILAYCQIWDMQVPDSCLNFGLLSNLGHARASFMFKFWPNSKIETRKAVSAYTSFRTYKFII